MDTYGLRERIARQQLRTRLLREVGADRAADVAQHRVDELRGQLADLLEDEEG